MTAYRWIAEHLLPANIKILDYGSGPSAKWSTWLQTKGFDVTAHDLGSNFTSEIHDPHALERKYDIVVASNVLNVQPTKKHLKKLVRELEVLVQPGGMLVVNYPKEPRKAGVSDKEFKQILMPNRKRKRIVFLES